MDCIIPEILAFKFAEWISAKRYIQCANGEWIQFGTGEYNVVAKSTADLYEIFKH